MRRAIALALLALAQCEGDPAPAAPPDRPAQHIIVGEGYAHQFDARSGDRVDLIMEPDDGWVDRCLHSGGEPIWNPYSLIASCEGVDF